MNLLTTAHEGNAQFTLCSTAKPYLSKIMFFQKKKKMEKGQYKCRLECELCIDCTQLPSKAILGKRTSCVGDSAVAVEEGNAAHSHSTPRTWVTSAEMGMRKDMHSNCSRMGSSSKNADLSNATEHSVWAQFGQKSVHKLKKKSCIKVKKQKYKSSNAAFFRAVIMN